MAITINGTTGIAGVDGSAATPSVQGADTNTGIFFPAADTIAFAEGGAEVMRINSSGNVGIGTTSPTSKLTVNGAFLITGQGRSTTGWAVSADGSTFTPSGLNAIPNYGTGYITSTSFTTLAGFGGASFYTNQLERMRIDGSGNVLVGSSTLNATSSRLTLNGASANWGVGPSTGSSNFFVSTAASGSGVYLTTAGTSWTSNSDERLKTKLTPFQNALNKVCTLRAGTGRYLTDEETVSRSFLIAQDVQAVLPEAVNVQDDEIGTLGLQYTEVVPLLVAAIQEQQALITQLQADVAALKGTP